jgi:hypothetical protein
MCLLVFVRDVLRAGDSTSALLSCVHSASLCVCAAGALQLGICHTVSQRTRWRRCLEKWGPLKLSGGLLASCRLCDCDVTEVEDSRGSDVHVFGDQVRHQRGASSTATAFSHRGKKPAVRSRVLLKSPSPAAATGWCTIEILASSRDMASASSTTSRLPRLLSATSMAVN